MEDHEEALIKVEIYLRRADFCDRGNCSNNSSIASVTNDSLTEHLDGPSIVSIHFGSVYAGKFTCDEYCEHDVFNNRRSVVCPTQLELLKKLHEGKI